MLEKHNIEVKFEKPDSEGLQNNIKEETVDSNNQVTMLEKHNIEVKFEKPDSEGLQNNIKEETIDSNNQINMMERSFEQENRALKLRISELEKKLEEATQNLVAAQSTITSKDIELSTLQKKLSLVDVPFALNEETKLESSDSKSMNENPSLTVDPEIPEVKELYDILKSLSIDLSKDIQSQKMASYNKSKP